MEFDQIFKRLDWLDEQHRKDKASLEALSEQLADITGELKVANKKIKELNTSLSPLSTTSARIDQFNDALTKQRVDILKYVDEMDNKDVDKLPEAEKRFQTQIESINKSLVELRKFKDPIAEVKRELKSREAVEGRQNLQIAGWENRFQEIKETITEIQLIQKAAEGPRRQDSKRLADLQGPLTPPENGWMRFERRMNFLPITFAGSIHV